MENSVVQKRDSKILGCNRSRTICQLSWIKSQVFTKCQHSYKHNHMCATLWKHNFPLEMKPNDTINILEAIIIFVTQSNKNMTILKC